MIKTNLPVIILKGLVLLPHNELRLEVKLDIDKNIIDLATNFHEDHVLIVTTNNQLDSNVAINELPKIGVIAKIKSKMELPNGNMRALLIGVNRATVFNYVESTTSLEAIIGSVTKYAMDTKDETALSRKILKELDLFVHSVPYASNSILAQIENSAGVNKLTDLIAGFIPLSFERKFQYLTTINPYDRAMMLISDMQKEMEILNLEKKIDLELKEQLDKAQKEYILREKIRLIKEELGDINSKDEDIQKLRERIDASGAPEKIISKLKSELKKYEMSPSTSPEVGIIRNYIDTLLSLPWTEVTEDESNLKEIRKSLDASHFGLEKIKDRIIEFIAVKQFSNLSKGPIICLVGPPGVGKTSLAKSIANSLHRNFVKISVGGVNDEAEIIGHRRTYIGANPGRIINAMKKANSINPVFLIDEIDKMTKDIKGDPASTLLEVLDPEQNRYFYDNYVEEAYDLSKVMFILTANYLYQIPEALRDRLEIIEISGYTEYEKLDIAKKHLLPKEIIEHGLTKNLVNISDPVLMQIIRNYTKEAGVRELERSIASVIRKHIKGALEENKINEPLVLKSKTLETYLGKPKYFSNEKSHKDAIGIVNGLAYTYFGGDILPIEVNYYHGKGNLILTGSLGEVMKESAQIAMGYIKSNFKKLNVNYEILENNDLHVHLPEGAVPKDGPSAGIALTTAIISAITDKEVKHNIAMTGEITLRGFVLPIGGLKEKVVGAHRNKIKNIIIPKENEQDLSEIPDEIKKEITFYFVRDYQEVYNLVFKNGIIL